MQNHGEIILYQSENGGTVIDVRLEGETVWLTQAHMAELFGRDKRTVSEHIRNVFKEGELSDGSVVRNFRTTGQDGKKYQTNFYSLDVIISVGYRIKSQRGTLFRIWATSVLRDHLVQGYSLNQSRLEEKGTRELQDVLSLLTSTLENHELVNDEGRAVLDIICRYANTWRLLLQYDEDKLNIPKNQQEGKVQLDIDGARRAVASLKDDLLGKGEATGLFGQERGAGLAGILGAIWQTYGGDDLYPSVAEKAAHLLYFVVKDHPFSDGNKRIGTFLFVLFLEINGQFSEVKFSNNALVALTLLTATSDPSQKDLLVRLIVNLLSDKADG